MNLGERFKGTFLRKNKMINGGRIVDQSPIDPSEKARLEIASRVKSVVLAVDERAARAIGFKGTPDDMLRFHRKNEGVCIVSGKDEKGNFTYKIDQESISFVLTKPQVLIIGHKEELEVETSSIDFSSSQITKKQYHPGGDLTEETTIKTFNSESGLKVVILQRKGLFRTDGPNFSTFASYTDPDLAGNIVLQFPVIGLNKMREQIFEAEKVLDPKDGPKIVIHSSKGASDIKGLIVGDQISFRADNSPGFSVKTKENIPKKIAWLSDGFI